MKNYIFIGFFFILSCNSKIAIDTMADILFDVSLAVNYTHMQKISDSAIMDSMLKKALDTICAIHHITPKELKENTNYYVNRPTDMQIILDTIQQRTQRLLNKAVVNK